MHRLKSRQLADLLSAQADELIHGNSDTATLLAMYPELADEAAPLMALANVLASLFQPVPPRPAYRTHLYQGLVNAAQRKRARQTAAQGRKREPWRPWVLGAAAVGSAVSVLGIIAYLIHSRHHGRMGQVASH